MGGTVELAELVRVRFVQSVASITGQYAPWEEYELPRDKALKHIAAGNAVLVEPEPETAMEQNAPRRRGRPRNVETR